MSFLLVFCLDLVCRPFLNGRFCFFLCFLSVIPCHSCSFGVYFCLVHGVPRSLVGSLGSVPCRDVGDITDTLTEPIDDLPGSQVERLRLACLPKLAASQTLLWFLVVARLLSWAGVPDLGPGLKPPVILIPVCRAVSGKLWSGPIVCYSLSLFELVEHPFCLVAACAVLVINIININQPVSAQMLHSWPPPIASDLGRRGPEAHVVLWISVPVLAICSFVFEHSCDFFLIKVFLWRHN